MGGSKDVASEKIRFSEGCLYRLGKTSVEGAAAGILVGAGLLSWYPDPYRFDIKSTVVPKALNVGHVLRGMRSPVLWSSLVCGVYGGVECVMEQLRDEAKSSTWVNSAVAGAAAGMVMGSMSKRIDIMALAGLGVGVLMGMVEFNGQTYVSDSKHAQTKWKDLLPPKTKETTTVEDLKKLYPEFAGL